MTDTSLELMVTRMADMRLPAEMIAQATETPLREVRIILERQQGSRLSPAEQELAEKVRSLANVAIAEAHKMLVWGPPEQKLRVMQIVLSNAAKLIGQDNAGGAEEYRSAFQQLMGEMRSAPQLRTVVTDEEIIDVVETDTDAPTSTPPFTTYD